MPAPYNSIIEAVHSSPLVKINKLGVKCDIYAKCDFLLPGGSIFDRAAVKVLQGLAESGKLKKGMTVVISRGGSYAVSFAMACSVFKYKLLVVTDDRDTQGVINLLKTQGAELVRVAKHEAGVKGFALSLINEGGRNDRVYVEEEEYEKSVVDTINEAVAALPSADLVFVPAVHEYSTTDGKPAFNGKVMRVARKPDVNYPRSPVAVPDLATAGSTTEEVVVDDEEAYEMARTLAAREGLLVGPSSGAAVKAAVDYCNSKCNNNNCTIVVICLDGIRNYLDHYVDNEWIAKYRLKHVHPNEHHVTPKKEFNHDCLNYDPTQLKGGHWTKDGHFADYKAKINEFRQGPPKVMPTILDAIGNTPLVRLHTLPEHFGVECNVYAKCEYMNAGGSIKDRIAIRMFELGEAEGQLHPGMTVIEPTSGNTGIGLSLVAAVKDYKCIIVMPEKMSKEKALTVEALGATIVRTPNDAAFNSAESHIGVSLRLQQEIKDSVILDQYCNIGNPLAHYEQTAEEILRDLDDKVDYVVVGTGTGGSVSGVAMKIKERCPDCQIVGVDPHGSLLADPSQTDTHFYEVEGVGYDFLPGVLNRGLVDRWVKTGDKDSFETARKVIEHEGLLCGGSSGANVFAALMIARGLPKDKKVVALLPDGVRNYLTKFLCDDWMFVRGYHL